MEAPTTVTCNVRTAEDFHVHALSGARLIEGRCLAVGLVAEQTDSLPTMTCVHKRTDLGLLGVTHAGLNSETDLDDRSVPCGLFRVATHTAACNQAVLVDAFAAVCPDPAQVCTLEDEPAGLFDWGIAVSRHEATRLLENLGLFISEHITPAEDWWARTVTDDAARLAMGRMTLSLLEGTKIGSLWIKSYHNTEANLVRIGGAARSQTWRSPNA